MTIAPEFTEGVRKLNPRAVSYALAAAGLAVFLLTGGAPALPGNPIYHTSIETVAAMLAVFIGVLALLRYYTRPNVLFLFVGVAFLGAAVLDAILALATTGRHLNAASAGPGAAWPAGAAAPELFLSAVMVLCLLAWRKDGRLITGVRDSGYVICSTVTALLFSGLLLGILMSVHLGYFHNKSVYLAAETAAALFFLAAFAGFLRKSKWRTLYFDYWLTMSLIAGAASQAAFIFFSREPMAFDLAHILKTGGYVCVLTGLLASNLVIFRREARITQSLTESEQRVRAIVDNIFDAVITINSKGIIQSANPAAESIFGYTASYLIGRNVNILMPENEKAHHDSYIRAFQNTGDAKIIGNGRRVNGRRADGSVFPMNLEVAELPLQREVLFLGVARDISKHMQAERAKSEFIAAVSHELRTPLTSIKGSLSLIQSGNAGPVSDSVDKLTGIADRNCDRLIQLINDILDIARIDAGSLEITYSETDLSALLRQSLEDYRHCAIENDVQFEIIEMPPTAFVLGDRKKLMQVMYHLLSNAAKFSPAGSSVDISLTERDGGYRISVRDYGPGIDPDFLPKIFNNFSQANSSDTRQSGGSGLGLSIAKAIVAKHDGTLGVETTSGQGTTFHIDFPAIAGDELAGENTPEIEQHRQIAM